MPPSCGGAFCSKIDPITNFSEHDKAKLESALNNPRRMFDGKDLYPTFAKKAAILYYGLIKGHCFKNGNKRTATATLLVFLYLNNFRIEGVKREIEDYLVDLARRTAASEGSKDMQKFLSEIENWLNKNMRKISSVRNYQD